MLLVTHRWRLNDFGGRQSYSKSTFKVLKEIFGESFNVYYINPYRKQTLVDKFFSLRLDYLTVRDVENICKFIIKNNIKIVIIDGSGFGLLCKKIKLVSKFTNIVVIYHHVEFIFYIRLFFLKFSFRTLGIAFKMYFSEKLSSNYSDMQTFLTRKDCCYAEIFYSSKTTRVLPISLPSPKRPVHIKENYRIYSPYILFVGGGKLVPNFEGIKWFIRKILINTNLKLVIVGSGYNSIASLKLKNYKNVFFLGNIKNLYNVYKQSEFVIAPIFSGSGMKTKLAEATSYGKTVFATSHALIGYENLSENFAISCNNEKEFLYKIKRYKYIIKDKKKIISMFKKYYSEKSMKIKFLEIKKFFNYGDKIKL